ncbi:MAG: DNA helicase [Desulfobacteraceae bacterium]|nr:MAG: DNA helicase [Desulfobacteraceae bacterium]
MEFVADFHIHSRYSRATARTLDLENLHISAQLKGVSVVGTGDFAHPGWFAEIKDKLIPAEEGLFKLRKDLSDLCDEKIPPACRSTVRFILTTEISNIYKKGDRTRKNHNLVFVPDLETAERLRLSLGAIGNITSDGRPILGLDARDLLEIVLEKSEQAFLIPAHIWTPWFSLLGSKSGFDSIEECFEDLTPHIFAVETGLSSDPPMNWRVPALDRFTLISNSDAHSPANIGREANLFRTDMNYRSIMEALQKGDPDRFLGTVEFYPQEGKYHFDGHRHCGVCQDPSVSKEKGGLCPVCGKPITLGVLYRVETLALRPEGGRPERYHPFYSLIPLAEILSEIFNTGAKSKRVEENYRKLSHRLGSEFDILQRLPLSMIEESGIPLLSEAIGRMRRKAVTTAPGYDGEYGKIHLFTEGERKHLLGQKSLFHLNPEIHSSERFDAVFQTVPLPLKKKEKVESAPSSIALNPEQRDAVCHPGGPALVVAGPGTGKTRTLTERIAYLISEKKVPAQQILAVTFTHKAAEEMRQRLLGLLDGKRHLPSVATFHALCHTLIRELEGDQTPEILDEKGQLAAVRDAIRQIKQTGVALNLSPEDLLRQIASAKQRFKSPHDPLDRSEKISEREFQAVYGAYQSILSIEENCDYEDLLFMVISRFKKDPILLKRCQDRFRYIFVDEYQDLNHAQYTLIRALSPPGKNLFAIGDPDQSIYGFRGSDVGYFKRFIEDYPDARIIHLKRNYRSTKTILECCLQVIRGNRRQRIDTAAGAGLHSDVYSVIDGIEKIQVCEFSSGKAEAVSVARTVEKLVGGTGYHSIDSGRVDHADFQKQWSFADIAILFRTAAQGDLISEAFEKTGIPYQIVSKEKILHAPGVFEGISLFKLVEEKGTYSDLEAFAALTAHGVGKRTLDRFKSWGYRNRFPLSSALRQIRRTPVPGMSLGGQQKMFDFLVWLDRLKAAVKNLSVEEKLRCLFDHPSLRTPLQENPHSEKAFSRLLDLSKRAGANSRVFFAEMSFLTDTDIYDPCVQRVSLMTMHASKGLEFAIVFIVGCEDGFIPLNHFECDPEEERRLLYVAMTRAREQLFLTRAERRSLYGKSLARTLSPFVADIEHRLRNHLQEEIKKHKKEKPMQLELF